MIDPDKDLWIESLTALFECATEGIIITDSEGFIIKANPSAENLFGYEKNSLPGNLVEELIPSRFTQNHKEHRQNFTDNPRPRAMGKNMCLVAKRKDGTEFPVEISLTQYKKDDKPYVISFIIDITERKQYEEYIQKLNQELEKKVEERTQVLQQALVELENSKEQLIEALKKEKMLNDMKSRFITMASHEFRTPLSTISSSMSLIEKYKMMNDDEKHHKHVQRVRSTVTDMTLLLGDFLAAEKLNDGLIKIEKSEFSLKELTNEVIEEMNNLLQPGQQIIYNHNGNDNVIMDKQVVRNALMNLISNAIKFSGEHKKIEVDVSVTARETVIKVSDDGIGIPEEEKPFLFQRFFRAKNATNFPGIGLGLSTIAKYIELMNGKIDLISELNKGTTFIITIPS